MGEEAANLDTAAPDEHVPEVERNIRVIKYRICSALADMPYTKIPSNFKKELVLICVSLLNMIPRKAGLSKTLSPWTIMTRRALDYKKHCRVAAGEYCLIHEEKKPRNSMRHRASAAIAIGPCPTLHGGYRLLHLGSGRIITRRNFTKMPITDLAIERVETLAKEEDAHVHFRYNGTSYSTEDPPDPTDYPEEDESVGADDLHQDFETSDAEDDRDNQSEGDSILSFVEENENEEEDDIGPIDENDTERDCPGPTIENEPGGPATRTRATAGNSRFYRLDDAKKATLALQKSKPKQQFESDFVIGASYLQMIYGERKSKCIDQTSVRECIEGWSSGEGGENHTMMNLAAGIKEHGKRAEEAVMLEFQQFHKQDVLRPRYAYALSALEKSEALRLIMTIKEKRSGKIKGRGCADGRKLRTKISSEEATSPTVTREAFLISCAIDAKEKRFVATCDVPGAYLHCKMDEVCYVLLEGVLVDLYLKVNPAAEDMVCMGRNGKKRLYTKMNKALYGHMRSGRLFWEHISAKLVSLEFESNPDDLCVMNKMVGEDQFTIVLHVDDLKLSFATEEGIDEVLDELRKEYGNLEVQKGKLLEYLGLTLDYRTEGVVKIDASSYIQKALDGYGLELKGKARTPAADDLFTVRSEAEALNEDERK